MFLNQINKFFVKIYYCDKIFFFVVKAKVVFDIYITNVVSFFKLINGSKAVFSAISVSLD